MSDWIIKLAAATLQLPLCIQLAFAASQQFPMHFEGQIVYVEDGDTLTMATSERLHVIRLTDLDAPERSKPRLNKPGQPYSHTSRRHLQAMAKGKQGKAKCYEYDHNGRLVCRVFIDGQDVSLAQIKEGFAWANGASRRFVRDAKAYEYERESRTAGRGLWQDPKPIQPWVWRRVCWRSGQCKDAGN